MECLLSRVEGGLGRTLGKAGAWTGALDPGIVPGCSMTVMVAAVSAGLRHFRHAARALRRTPTLTLASIVTLTIGVGPTTAIFSVVYGVLLRPLPYPDPAALVQVNYLRTVNGQLAGFSISELSDWTNGPRAFDGFAMYGSSSFNLVGGSETEVIRGAMVSERFFPLLQPHLPFGRALGADDAATPDVVLSTRVWQRRFGRDAGILGHAVTLNGVPYSVVGIAPATFQFPADDIDAWIPLGFARTTLAPQWQMRGFRAFSLIGHLAPGATLTEARTEVAATARTLAHTYPRFNADLSADLTSLRDRLTSSVRPALLMLFGAVGCVWLIACANVVNLALARSALRVREVAVRTALGARRTDLAAQCLAEGTVLAAAGAALGMGLAELCLNALIHLPALNLPRLEDIRIDAPVLAFGVALSAIATLVFGTAPAMGSSQARPIDALRDARGVTSMVGRRIYQTLVVAEVAIAIVLLVGASLFERSLAMLLRTDTGARASGVLTLRMNIASTAMADPAQQAALVDRVAARVSAVPGVATVGVTSNLPPNLHQMRTSFTLRSATTA